MLPSKTIKKSIRIVEFATRHNVIIDADEARQFLNARKTLAAKPSDGEALRVFHHYEVLFHFAGSDPSDFGVFVNSPSCPPGCAECAERRRRREAR